MKVIATTERGFILEAHKDEVANLIGFHYASQDGIKMPKIGDNIEVAAMYQRLYRLEANKNALKDTAERIRGVADLLEAVNPIVEAAG